MALPRSRPQSTHTYNVKQLHRHPFSEAQRLFNTYSKLIRVTIPPIRPLPMLPPIHALYTFSALNLSNADGPLPRIGHLTENNTTSKTLTLTIDSLLDVKQYTLTLYTTMNVAPYPGVIPFL